jgi:hypothetical protein
MAQQINLFDESLRPRRERWRAVHGLWVVGGTLAAAWLMALALDALSVRRQAEAQRIEQQAAAERQQLTPASIVAGHGGRNAQAELERLRAMDAGQQRVQTALQSQAGGRAEGYTPYFLALSRQAQPSLWITGFGIGQDGDSLELQGRMLDASVLPGYLRKLNAEPQFKGRAFAQLSMKVADSRNDPAAAGYTEFLLRSRPAASTEAAGNNNTSPIDSLLRLQSARAEVAR